MRLVVVTAGIGQVTAGWLVAAFEQGLRMVKLCDTAESFWRQPDALSKLPLELTGADSQRRRQCFNRDFPLRFFDQADGLGYDRIRFLPAFNKLGQDLLHTSDPLRHL